MFDAKEKLVSYRFGAGSKKVLHRLLGLAAQAVRGIQLGEIQNAAADQVIGNVFHQCFRPVIRRQTAD
ncbi:hypothetical protein NIBR502770_06145 [Pseudarthrobacter sp. NIBRBAC000502770]|nr:hypothetical protein NIBR502770_06145 [Pseudarthrobacter sp. NIBRBAC000502770]